MKNMPSRGSQHWSGTGQLRGGRSGIWFFITALRVLGLRLTYALLPPVALYYSFVSPDVHATMDYHERVFGIVPWWKRRWLVFRHFLAFGMALIDRTAILAGKTRQFSFSFDGEDHLRAAVAKGHATAPHPQGAGAAEAIRSALRRANLEPGAIDYVNAHGTGTRDNDVAEASALKTVFGQRVPPVSSTKRFFGHSLAASGAIEAVLCVEALRRAQMPPNIGFTTPDPAIGIEPVKEMRQASLTHVMSNSFGFGGNNAVLIFSRPEAPALTRSFRTKPVAVTGLGVIGPGVVVNRQIEPPLVPETLPAHSCGTLAGVESLSPNQRRRLNRLVQMALIAARGSHSTNSAQRVAITMGTGMGCLEEGAVFIENLISKDEREPMPARFPGSVHNAPAAQIAIDQQARGLNSAPTMGEISFECALWQATNQLWAGDADCAVAGAVDELNKYVLSIGKRWGQWTEQTRPGEGAVAVNLALPENAKEPLAKVTAIHLGRYRRPFDPKREADWIASKIDLGTFEVVLSGAGGLPELDPMYQALVTNLSQRIGKTLEHQTYKQLCGEFHAASGFGFSKAVELVREGKKGVLLYTLSLRGGRAITLIQ